MSGEQDAVVIQKTDALGTLCAVIVTILQNPDPSLFERAAAFLMDLSCMVSEHGYGGDPYRLFRELLDENCGPFYRIHVIYRAFEQTDLQSADVFTLLARYDAGPDAEGHFILRADGDAPPIWTLSAIKGRTDFNGKFQ